MGPARNQERATKGDNSFVWGSFLILSENENYLQYSGNVDVGQRHFCESRRQLELSLNCIYFYLPRVAVIIPLNR